MAASTVGRKCPAPTGRQVERAGPVGIRRLRARSLWTPGGAAASSTADEPIAAAAARMSYPAGLSSVLGRTAELLRQTDRHAEEAASPADLLPRSGSVLAEAALLERDPDARPTGAISTTATPRTCPRSPPRSTPRSPPSSDTASSPPPRS